MSVVGHRCVCGAEWNVWGKVPEVRCPNCTSTTCERLGQAVPFAVRGGTPPDHVYNCICGRAFQSPPRLDNPHERDVEKLKNSLKVTCPYCGRHNMHKGEWYVRA